MEIDRVVFRLDDVIFLGVCDKLFHADIRLSSHISRFNFTKKNGVSTVFFDLNKHPN